MHKAINLLILIMIAKVPIGTDTNMMFYNIALCKQLSRVENCEEFVETYDQTISFEIHFSDMRKEKLF